MAIVIKEIHVKATVGTQSARVADEAALRQMRNEIIKEVKEMMRRERMHKNER